MVVTGPENIYYLTGQQTPGYYTFQALVLPVDGEPVFVVRQLEYFNFIANTFVTDAEVYQDGDQPVELSGQRASRRAVGRSKRVAIDKRGWFLPIAIYEALQDKLGTIADGAGIIEQLRIVKSPAEIEKIETRRLLCRGRHARGAGRGEVWCERERFRCGHDGFGHQGGLRICRHGAAGLRRPALGRAARHLASRQARDRTSRSSSKWPVAMTVITRP